MRASSDPCEDDSYLCQKDKLEYTNSCLPVFEQKIIECFENELKGLCYTQNQLKEIISQMKGRNLLVRQEEIQKGIILTYEYLKTQGKQTLNQLLHKAQDQELESSRISLTVRSRLFYCLGNEVSKSGDIKQFEIDELSEDQIEELVKYEMVEHEVERMSRNFSFKHSEIQDNSKKMKNLFNYFQKKQKILGDSSFFRFQNGLEAAHLSRGGCDHDTKAIFILFNFIIRSILNLYKSGKSIQEIETIVGNLIKELGQKYPPGQGLNEKDKHFQSKLESMNIKWFKESPDSIENPLIYFNKASNNKKEELERQIKEIAEIAAGELQCLQQIIRETCLAKSIKVNSNLKLSASDPNPKAIIRIIEKMLLKTTNNQVPQERGQNKEDLGSYLKRQDTEYQQKIEKELQDRENIQFTISDMVRGKCTFLKIQDIIEAVENIKRFVDENPKRFRILEIESRFTKKIPISDVTLKFSLNQRIVAQLQLTLQANVATYAFAHKIYELQRCKSFSKVKTVFNYYEEYGKEFKELLETQIQLFKEESKEKYKEIFEAIAQHFNLSNIGKGIPKLRNFCSVKNQLGDNQKVLAQAVFERIMKKQDHQRSLLFKEHLRSSQGKNIFNSVLFYQALKDIDITERLEICRQQHSFHHYLQSKITKNDNWKFYLNTIRIVMKFQELKFLDDIYRGMQQFYLQSINAYEKLTLLLYGEGRQYLSWVLKKGRMFGQRLEVMKSLENYQKALLIAKERNNWNDPLILEIKRKQSQALILNNQLTEAQKLIEGVPQIYKEKQQYKKAMICQLLLSECALKQNQYNAFIEAYKQAMDLKLLNMVNYDGPQVIRWEYRIGLYLLENLKNAKEAQHSERIQKGLAHLNLAFEEAHYLSHAEIFLGVKHFWKHKELIQTPPNPTVKTLKLKPNLFNSGSAISHEGCQYLSGVFWSKLQLLELDDNKIGDQGCNFLSMISFPCLRTLSLGTNGISDEGCEYLSKLYYPQLQSLSLGDNKIGDQGCKSLSSVEFPKLSQLSLYLNHIGPQGCFNLSQNLFLNLQTLLLAMNRICDEGCQYLSKSLWPQLKYLQLDDNQIGPKGCEHLSLSKWSKLEKIQLSYNKIGDQGYECFSGSAWENLNIFCMFGGNLSAYSDKEIKDNEKCKGILGKIFPKAKVNL